jgi:hypothetical protein
MEILLLATIAKDLGYTTRIPPQKTPFNSDDREIFNEDGDKISEWDISIDDIRIFLEDISKKTR